VYKSAHKGCDTIKDWNVMRRVDDAVHLEGLRCDGSAHGGCQAACLFYWKTDWLKPVAKTAAESAPARAPSSAPPTCTLESLAASTRATPSDKGEERFRCQATEHLEYTEVLGWRNPRAYWKDLTSGNVKPLEFVRYALLAFYNILQRRYLGGRTWPRVFGLAGDKTPTEQLDLKPGELVQVRSQGEIMKTINAERKNRGLTFDVEMVPYCGRTFRVLARVEKIINERTGIMIRMPRDCLVLDGVFCGGCLSQYRLFCPRAIYPYWREIWLRRVK
jgi:hypothetical protein